MKVTTQAIVLHALKYSDTSLIVKMYTRSSGIKSYLLRGVLSSKKGKINAAYFQTLSLLEVVANHKQGGALSSLSEVRVAYPYQTLQSDFFKNAIGFFLSEVLLQVLNEEEENPNLFEFISAMLQWLDVHDQVANFHLYFLLQLTRYLGFFPDEIQEDALFFDLIEGSFVVDSISVDVIDGEQLALFKRFLKSDLTEISAIKMTKATRLQLLQKILIFYQLHSEGFRKLKSLEVLTQLMA